MDLEVKATQGIHPKCIAISHHLGYRGNWITPNAGDPVSGAHRVFDRVVAVTT